MKIAMLTTVHPAHDVRITAKEARALAAAGHDVTLIARDGTGTPPPEIGWHPLTFPPGGRLLRPLRGGVAAATAVRVVGPDVIHFHDPELMPVALRLKREGYAVVYDAHEDLPADILAKPWVPRLARAPLAAGFAALERFCAPRFDAVVAATPTIGARFASYGARVTVVRNYASLNEFPAPTSVPKRRQAVYVGRISFDRGLVEMANACQRRGLPLVLAGPAGEAETAWLHAHREAYPTLAWRGTLDRSAIAALLAESAVGLCVLHAQRNYIDALPIKLFEYMAAGLPVITSDLAQSRLIVESCDCGWVVPPQDSEALASALDITLSNPDAAQAKGRQGRAAIETTYNWEQESRALCALYASLASRNNPS